MEQFIANLTAQITAHFQHAELQLSPVPGDRVGGFMTWENFEGIPQRERQRDLWDFIRGLPVQTQTRISSILTLTPGERESYLENVAGEDF